MARSGVARRTAAVLRRLVPIRTVELSAVLWAFAYFFCLLAGYYLLRPVRDEMGIRGGVEQLQWLFTGTFLAMLVTVPAFAWIAARFPRRIFVPLVYWFFIANLLIFFVLFRLGAAETALARAFFIWTSVFNLFVISVFWSFMADIFSRRQARRLFGFIAAGGSAGAVAGPGAAGLLAPALGPINLLPVSAGLLAMAVVCIHRLGCWDSGVANIPTAAGGPTEGAMGGGILTGVRRVLGSSYLIGICLFILLYTMLATFLYFQQARLVEGAFADSGRRTAVFAWIDFAVNALTILGQVFLTHRLVARFDVGPTLALVPAGMIAGFAALAATPVLAVLLVFQVLRRAGGYAVARPAREMLFTVLDREQKYKSKNFIDTVVYRGGDAVAGWVYAGLAALGLGVGATAGVAVPVAALWLAVGLWLGRRYRDFGNESAPAGPRQPGKADD